MEQDELAVEVRESRGTGPARRMRRMGKVPAVIYGHGREATAIAVDARSLAHVLDTGRHMVRIRRGEEVHPCLIREVQIQPVTEEILHVDFVEVAADETVSLTVPVYFRGQPVGTKEGGVLDVTMREITISCRADAVVDALTVDVTPLTLGRALHVEDIEMPEGVEPLPGTKQLAVAVCRRPRGEAEEAEEAELGGEGIGATPAQPEVISETKREEREKG